MDDWLCAWVDRLSEPRPEFSGYSACPYAKSARLVHIKADTVHEARRTIDAISGLSPRVVMIFELPHTAAAQAHQLAETWNPALAKRDLVLLVSDPKRPMVIDGHRTTQRDRLLLILQQLTELRALAGNLEQGGYYAKWSDEARQRIAR